jgi:hypothetical protein
MHTALPCNITLGLKQQLGNCTQFSLGTTCTVRCSTGYYSTEPTKTVSCEANSTEAVPDTLCQGMHSAHDCRLVSGHHCRIMTCSLTCSMHANCQRHGPGSLHQRQRHARGGKGIYVMQRRLLPCARAHERHLPRHVRRTPSLLRR